jgi:tyrosyl-tRNA synthetase
MKPTIFPNTEKIDFSKKLKVKFGIDPTSDKLHLGHLIPLLQVKKLMDEGHHIDIVLGTFTARLGDPSGKDTMRPILDEITTDKNALSILNQVERILGDNNSVDSKHQTFRFIAHFNDSWFEKMTAIEMTNLLSKFTLTQLLSRDSFQKRFADNNPIGMHELTVPILQGFDSAHLKTDVEIGGNDQLFNFSITRDVQRVLGQTPEICMLMPIINGTDGRKMSKSFDNCIFINDTPRDVFGKTMSISDEMMKEWWSVFIGDNLRFGIETHPMEMKKELAFHITDIIWGEDAAKNEFDQFETLIQKKCLPDEMMEIELPLQGGISIIDIITQTRNCSKNEARRLIDGKGVRLVTELGDNTVIASGDSIFIMPGTIIKVGKRDFIKLI